MSDKLFTIVLALLVLALLILTPRHPWPDWRVPIYVFCGATLIWLAPELWALIRKKRTSTNSHKLKRGGRK